MRTAALRIFLLTQLKHNTRPTLRPWSMFAFGLGVRFRDTYPTFKAVLILEGVYLFLLSFFRFSPSILLFPSFRLDFPSPLRVQLVLGSAVSSRSGVRTRVFHGNGNGKIPRDYRGKTVETIIGTKPITAVTAETGTARAVIPLERESKSFFSQRNIDSDD